VGTELGELIEGGETGYEGMVYRWSHGSGSEGSAGNRESV
jgi:hypothetical protein